MHCKTKVKFHTSRFGELEVHEEKIIHFPDGVLGFPESKKYVLIDYKGTTIRWLQSVDDPDVAFIVVEPDKMFPDFSIQIDGVIRKFLELDESDSGLAILLMIRVENGKIIANINGPLLFNANIMRGIQIVNENVRPVSNKKT
ncbi:MAG: flagellar assembly protein FliW [Candidatus Magnetoovum sp. WYHC-5]|nr:flagellar assembly protein FliW [Candidatus Magnetoovum sp. WYHC-5]